MLPPIDTILEANMATEETPEPELAADDELYNLRATYKSVREIKLVLDEKQYEALLNTLHRVRNGHIAASRGQPLDYSAKDNLKHDMKLFTALMYTIEHERD